MAGSVKLTGDTDPLRGVRDVLRKLAELDAEVGYLDGGEQVADSPGLTLPTLAAIHEFGTDTIPARPFMTRAAAAAESTVASLAAREFSKVVDDAGDGAAQAMAAAAKTVARAIELELETTEQWATPVTAATLNRNGHAQPLQGKHGSLRAGVRYQVLIGNALVAEGNSDGK